VLTKALKAEPFVAQGVLLVPKERNSPVAFAEDVEEAVGHPGLLEFLLETGRTDAVQAFSVAELKGRLSKLAQRPFVEFLARQMEAGSLPAGVGWISAKKERLLFRLQDVRGAQHSALLPLPSSSEAQPLRPAPADFDADFEEAFARLDRQTGSHNFVSLVDLRRALPFDRATFDAHLRRLREARRYTLGAAEGRDGLTEEQRAAGIPEDGTLLLFVSRRVP
jgi:hypothetical protein